MLNEHEKLLWTYEDAAQFLSMSVQALRDLVYKGRGPKRTHCGRRVFFKPSDVIEWVNNLPSY